MSKSRSPRTAALEANVENLGREMGEVKAAVGKVYDLVTEVKLSLATVPKQETVAGLDVRIRKLEDEENKRTGGLKVVATVASLIGTGLGWLLSYLTK